MPANNLNEKDLPKLRSSKSGKTKKSSVEKNHLEKYTKLPELPTTKRVVPETSHKNGQNKKPGTFSNETHRYKSDRVLSSRDLVSDGIRSVKTKGIFLPPITQQTSALKKDITPIFRPSTGVKKRELRQDNYNKVNFKELPPIKTDIDNSPATNIGGKKSPKTYSNVGSCEVPTRETSKEESKYQQFVKEMHNASEENIKKRLLQSTHNLDSQSKATLDVLKRMCPNTDIYRQIFRGFRPVSTWSDSSEGSSEEEYLSLSRFSVYSSDNDYSTDVDFNSATPSPPLATPPVSLSRRQITTPNGMFEQSPDHSTKTDVSLQGAHGGKDNLLKRSRKEMRTVYGSNVKPRNDASKKPLKTTNDKLRKSKKRIDKIDIIETRAIARPFDTSL